VSDWVKIFQVERFGLRLRPPAAANRLADGARALGVQLPTELWDLLRYTDGFEDTAGQWECAWSIERIVTENLQAWRQHSLPVSLLAFGDDGASTCFCMSMPPVDAQVARWSWIDQDIEETYPDLRTFWRLWLNPSPNR
jgi:cell wall assembly regulator SMI1